mmetsp:Transcript_11345/g.22460  ORF Transcript_11345/g.22460 Transcript_11345/m.22460 type:complete len:289 (-) Transcript_11345:209-1075(-)
MRKNTLARSRQIWKMWKMWQLRYMGQMGQVHVRKIPQRLRRRALAITSISVSVVSTARILVFFPFLLRDGPPYHHPRHTHAQHRHHLHLMIRLARVPCSTQHRKDGRGDLRHVAVLPAGPVRHKFPEKPPCSLRIEARETTQQMRIGETGGKHQSAAAGAHADTLQNRMFHLQLKKTVRIHVRTDSGARERGKGVQRQVRQDMRHSVVVQQVQRQALLRLAVERWRCDRGKRLVEVIVTYSIFFMLPLLIVSFQIIYILLPVGLSVVYVGIPLPFPLVLTRAAERGVS